ncbi:hypothetical protein [Gallaecimonas sp. GXIMD1310]|uniref:hypothetical protein n=1 Tax=Gallaecimonas sp. GXIMD1310 TaxID=3131926 RepID=UPI0032435A4A
MKLKTILLAGLFFSSTAAMADGMSCFVDTSQMDSFTPTHCGAIIYGATQATAVFKIDPLPANYYIDWHNPGCAANATMCTTVISSSASQSYKATATVIDLDAGTVTDVWATAHFEDGR